MTTATVSHPTGAGEAPATAADRPGRLHVIALAAIVLLAIVARVVPLREPIRYDEAYTFLTYVVRPIREIVEFYNLPNNHILNSVLMHESVDVLGNHLWSLRLPSWIAGVLLVPVAYGAGRALYGSRAGLWAAALAASSAPLIDFAVIARGYSLGLFFVMLALWMAALAINGARWWVWPPFALAGALALWSVPTMAPGMAVVGLWAGTVLVIGRRWRTLALLAASSAAAAAIAYLLYRPTIGQDGWKAGELLPRDWASVQALAEATWANWNRALPWPVEIVAGAAFLGGLMLHRRIGRQPVPLGLVAVALLACSLLTGVGAGRYPRFWLAYLPFFLLTAAAGVTLATNALQQRRPAFATAVPVAVAAVLVALVIAAGQAGAEEPPTGDNAISGYLYRTLKVGEAGAHRQTFAPAVDYYLFRDGLPLTIGHVTEAMRRTGRAILVVPGHDEYTALLTLRLMEGVPGEARLLRDFEYLSVWEVEVLG